MKNQFDEALKAKAHREKQSPTAIREKAHGLGPRHDNAERIKNGRVISSTRADKK